MLAFNSVADLQAATVATTENYVYCTSYYNDTLEWGAAANWQRSSTAGPGDGLRQSADGAWWMLAEPDIDPCMLGARSSDSTTDSSSAMLEAHRLAYKGGPSFPSGRKIVYRSPRKIAYPVSPGSYNTTQELPVTNGSHIIVYAGAMVKAILDGAGHYSNGSGQTDTDGLKAVFGSAYNVPYQAQGAKLDIHGYIDCNGVADLGIYVRSAWAWNVVADGMILNGVRGGIWVGSPSALSPFENTFSHIRITASYATTWAGRPTDTQTVNNAGFYFQKATDNRAEDLVIVGYYTGYRDDGANNNVAGVHCYTFGRTGGGTPTVHGPMPTPFILNGSFGTLSDLYADTPSSMGFDTGHGGSIPATYGLVFGTNSNLYVVRGLKVSLNYNDFSDNTRYDTGLCFAVCNQSQVWGTNSIDGIELTSASSNIKFNAMFTATGSAKVDGLVRTNVSWNSGSFANLAALFAAANPYGDWVCERGPVQNPIASTARKQQLLYNTTFNVWQRGAGVGSALDVSGAGYKFGPDLWFSYVNGTPSPATRYLQRVALSPAEIAASGIQSEYMVELTQTGSPTGTAWSLRHRQDYLTLLALSGTTISVSLMHRLVSGSIGGVQFVVRQYFGAGSPTADTYTGYTLPAPTGTLTRTAPVKLAIPSISSVTLGTNPFIDFYISLPVTGNYVYRVGEIDCRPDYENTRFLPPDPYLEDMPHAQRQYCQVNVNTIAGSLWVPFPKRMSIVPGTVAASVGVVSGVTTDGCLLTHTASAASTVTAEVGSAEPGQAI